MANVGNILLSFGEIDLSFSQRSHAAEGLAEQQPKKKKKLYKFKFRFYLN